MHLRSRIFLGGLAAMSLVFGASGGVLSGAISPQPAAGAQTSCETGINIGMGAAIVEGATTTLAPTQTVARVGDTIKYEMRLHTTTTDCPLSNVTASIKTPDGVTHVLQTGGTLLPGSSATYVVPPYTVNNSDIGTNSATPGQIHASGMVSGTATETGGSAEAVTAGTNYDIPVIHPETSLTKSASVGSGAIPLDVTYTFKEKNISSDPLALELAKDVITTVRVTDATGCTPIFKTSSDGTSTKLNVGATWTYTCSVTYNTVGTFVDHATASGVAGDMRGAGTATSLGAPQNETAEASVTTSPASPVISTSTEPATGLVGSTTLNDRVTLSGLVSPITQGTGVGTITVRLYAPSDPVCTGAPSFSDVISATSGNGTYTTTGGPTADQAGTWHWTAVYSGDANNKTATSSCTAEPVSIAKATAKISTTPQPSSGVVGSTSLNDKVTLSRLVDPVTSGTGVGTITVRLYPPSAPTCAGTPSFSDVITASSGNGTYTTTSGPMADQAGTWHWTAVYSGDANNTTATSDCTAEPVTIAKATPSISTNPQPSRGQVGTTALNDKVTLAGLVDPITSGAGAGVITVKLFSPSSPACTGTPIFTDVITASSGNGTYTTAGGPTASMPGTWHWVAVYSGDSNNNAVASGCSAEPVSVHIPPALTIVKSATPTTVNKAGQKVTYTFVVTDTGGTTLKGVSVTDKFTSPKTDTLSSPIDCVSLANPSGTCSGTTANLTVGQSATFSVTYTVTASDLANGVINNSATASGSAPTPTNPTKSTKVISTPSTASVATADLVTAKTVSPPSGTVVTPTEVLTYTLTFSNTDGTAPAPVAYTDNLSGVLDDASVITSPAETTGTGLTVSSISGGKFTITGTVKGGKTDEVTYKVMVNPVTKENGNHVLVNYLIPTGTTTPTSCKSTNPDCTINPVPGIKIVKSATPTAVTKAGQKVTYTFVVTDTGGTMLKGVSVTDKFTSPKADTLSSPIDCVSLSNPSGTCSGTTANLTVGQSATFSATYTVTTGDLANGVINNSATASGSAPTPVNPTKSTKVTSAPSTASVKATKVVTAAVTQTPTAPSSAPVTALPFTGAPLAREVEGAIVLILTGTGLVLIDIRRRRTS